MKIFFCFIAILNIFKLTVSGQLATIKSDFINYWDSTRIYSYHVVYSDSIGKVITTEKLTLHPTQEIWDIFPNQTLMDFKLDSIVTDWNTFPLEPLNGVPHSWMTNYREGVIQNINKVWMHPLRQNQYILTELAPFPEIFLPIQKDTTWNSTLWIYQAFGTFEGTVECTYTIAGEETRSYEFGKIICWKIIADGIHDKLGKNSVVFYFNQEYGFTEMNYNFYNRQKIELKLTGLKKK